MFITCKFKKYFLFVGNTYLARTTQRFRYYMMILIEGLVPSYEPFLSSLYFNWEVT